MGWAPTSPPETSNGLTTLYANERRRFPCPPSQPPGRRPSGVAKPFVSSGLVRTLAGMAKKYGEVRRALRAAGWVKIPHAGSHETWESADGTRAVTVAGKESDRVPSGTLAAIRRATGLKELR